MKRAPRLGYCAGFPIRNDGAFGYSILDIPKHLWLKFSIPSCIGVGQEWQKNDPQPSSDLLVLKTLSQRVEFHGYEIVLHIQRASEDLMRVEDVSVYPALHRMQQNGWISAALAPTETGRSAKYCKLTHSGKKHLKETKQNFEHPVNGVRAVLRYA